MADYQRQWLEETGGDRSKLMNFMNVEFAPLLALHPESANTLVLDRVAVALLHTVKLNPCNHILRHLESGHKEEVGAFYRRLQVVKDDYQGQKFEGECNVHLFPFSSECYPRYNPPPQVTSSPRS